MRYTIEATSFRSIGDDLLALEIHGRDGSHQLNIPASEIIEFYTAMVDALAPHVDEQRLAQLTAADEELVDLIASGAKLTIRGDVESEVA